MSDPIPTLYTAGGPPGEDDERLVSVRLPADAADELLIVTLWLSLQLGHRLPIPLLRRALVLEGVTNAEHVLYRLRLALGRGSDR